MIKAETTCKLPVTTKAPLFQSLEKPYQFLFVVLAGGIQRGSALLVHCAYVGTTLYKRQTEILVGTSAGGVVKGSPPFGVRYSRISSFFQQPSGTGKLSPSNHLMEQSIDQLWVTRPIDLQRIRSEDVENGTYA